MKQPLFKKWIPILLAVFLYICSAVQFPTITYAAGVSVTTSSDTVMVGDSVTVTVTLYGSEIYAYSGYIDCDSNLSGETGGFAEDGDGGESVSLSFTYYAVGEGTASIYVSDCEVSDGTDKEEAGEAVCTINVVGYDNGGGGTGGNAGGGEDDDYEEINGYEIGEGSDNTNLATLEVEGYSVKDEGNDIYSVSVGNSVDKINIIALPEDEYAEVAGDGEQTLTEGDNEFEILVYAENGFVRSYIIRVNRRGGKIALSDLTRELQETTEDTVTVSLKDGDKLSKEMIQAIAKWGKTLYLNRYDGDGKLLYGWTLIGKEVAELNNFESFDPTIQFDSNSAEKIGKLTNFAAGIILDFAYSGELPKKTVITIPAGDEFPRDKDIYLYLYNETDNTLTLEGQPTTVKGENIELELSHCSVYFLTRATLTPKEEVVEEEKDHSFSRREWILLFAVGAALIIIIVLAVILGLKKKSSAKRSKRSRKQDVFDDIDDLEDLDDMDDMDDLEAPRSKRQVTVLFDEDEDDDYEVTDLRR